MIYLKTEEEIKRIRESNRIVAESLKHIERFIEAGISTLELSREIEKYIVSKKAKPAFKGLYGFPESACISVNDEVVHGIPAKNKKLKTGDIVGIDIGVELNGYFGDSAYTFKVGKVEQKVEQLLQVTNKSLYLGIEQCHHSKRVGDIGHAIQQHVENAGFSIVRDLVGHGVGFKPHEDPQVPNYGKAGKGIVLKEGMVLALEPMVNMGKYQVFFAQDKWTVKTEDGSPSAHFEHSVAITKNGPIILSDLDGE